MNRALQNGQTVEIIAAKEGGPSRDWLNPELGYLVGHRAKSKVRAWFNQLAMEETVARGREAVERLLQREGRTALRFEDLASSAGLPSAQALFEQVGKDELSLRTLEVLLRQGDQPVVEDIPPWLKKPRRVRSAPSGGVLVVGVDSLMTQLAKCCKPAPPDDIRGFVTRNPCSIVRHVLRDMSEDPCRRVSIGERRPVGRPRSCGATGARSRVDSMPSAGHHRGIPC